MLLTQDWTARVQIPMWFELLLHKGYRSLGFLTNILKLCKQWSSISPVWSVSPANTTLSPCGHISSVRTQERASERLYEAERRWEIRLNPVRGSEVTRRGSGLRLHRELSERAGGCLTVMGSPVCKPVQIYHKWKTLPNISTLKNSLTSGVDEKKCAQRGTSIFQTWARFWHILGSAFASWRFMLQQLQQQSHEVKNMFNL